MNPLDNSFHILVIEDNLGDFILIEDCLSETIKDVEITNATTFSEVREYFDSPVNYSAILLDLSLPDVHDSESLVKEMVGIAGSIPVIVLTGYTNKEFGVKTLGWGISDYILKDDLNGPYLAKSIEYGIERKKVELQLSESERKYKSLFENSPLPMWVLDRHTLQFLSVNEAAIDLYGYSKEEFLNMTVRDLWVQDDVEFVNQVWEENYHDDFNVNVRHNTKRGELIHLEIRSNPIIFDGKEARVTLANNVTSQKIAELAKRNSEKRFKALVQDGSDLVMIMNFDGEFSYVSPSSKVVMGVNYKKLLKTNFFDYIHESDLKKVKECILELKEKKRIQIPSYQIKATNNTWRWIETIVTNSCSDPAVNGLVVNSRDITDFIVQEKKLIESLKRYDIVAKATSDTITDYDIKEDIMHYNEGIESTFGYCRKSIDKSGKWWEDKLHPDDRERIKKEVEDIHRNGHSHLQTEYRFRCANGNYKYILDRSYLVQDSNGQPLRMIGSMQDITKIHNYIETIERHNKRLKEIAWTQSHVVRAPLARIMGLIDLIKDNNGSIKEQCELLGHILTSAEELDAIIRKISLKTEVETNRQD